MASGAGGGLEFKLKTLSMSVSLSFLNDNATDDFISSSLIDISLLYFSLLGKFTDE